MIFSIIMMIVLAGLVYVYSKTRTYNYEIIEKLNISKTKLFILYPLSMYLLDKTILGKKLNEQSKLKFNLKLLYIYDDIKKIMYLHNVEKIALSLGVIIASLVLSLLISISDMSQNPIVRKIFIKRNEPHKNSVEYSLKAKIIGKGIKLEDEVEVIVEPRSYTKEQLEEKIKYSKEYLLEHMKGKNQSLDHVQFDLNLLEKIPNTNISVKWSSDNYSLIDESGKVFNEDIKVYEFVTLDATLQYKEERFIYYIPIKILPKELSAVEKIKKELTQALIKADEDTNLQKYYELPTKVNNAKVKWKFEIENNGFKMTFLGIIISIMMFFIKNENIANEVKKRNMEMQLDYPEIINKFLLLLGAGMTIKNAWGKISEDYKNKKSSQVNIKRFAYEELLYTWNEMQSGISEFNAYDKFGKRCNLTQYIKFSTIIIQNIQKGSHGLRDVLEHEVKESFEVRKEIAKRLGEEASTKLLGPMMIMLAIILIIIMFPALKTFVG